MVVWVIGETTYVLWNFWFLKSNIQFPQGDDVEKYGSLGLIIGVTIVILIVLVPLVVACVWFGAKKYDQLQEERWSNLASHNKMIDDAAIFVV